MKIEITLTEEMLGTASGNPELHKEYIASQSADAAKMEEELAALPAEALENKAKTVFPRDEQGRPFVWDYQIKGFLKETIGALLELAEKETKVGKTKLSKYTYKRLVDKFVFVFPRKIVLSLAVGPDCVRPLRAETMKGERVALASSETVPAGATLACEIRSLAPALDEKIVEALNYGALSGLGQWRNSGKGRFTWKEVGA